MKRYYSPLLTQGKVAIWKHAVKMAHEQPWGMFTLFDSRRHRSEY